MTFALPSPTATGQGIAAAAARLLQLPEVFLTRAAFAYLQATVPDFSPRSGTYAAGGQEVLSARVPCYVARRLDREARLRGMNRSELLRHWLHVGAALEARREG